MTEHYVKNAESVVTSFKELLSEDQREAVGEENFSQLTMLIEAGIANLLLLNMEKVADKIEDLAHAVRNDAERFDDN
ncbi:MAG: hypothetical protein MI754_02455 [Chromatiales bacterium]|nr:hypothetical protein [Chromatiales bacterium]